MAKQNATTTRRETRTTLMTDGSYIAQLLCSGWVVGCHQLTPRSSWLFANEAINASNGNASVQ